MDSAAGAFGGLVVMLVTLAISFAVFLLMREVWCWYWKINEGLAELRAIRAALENLQAQQRPHARVGPDGWGEKL